MIIKYIVPAVLIVALVAAISWLIGAPNFEPAVTSLALLASLLAIYIDRVLAEKERRKELLIALAHEIYMNVGVLKDIRDADNRNDNKPLVLPRFYTASLKSTVSSGIFTGKKDKKLWKLMTTWLQYSEDFNNRIAVNETRIFSNIVLSGQLDFKILQSKSATRTIKAFEDLYKCLFNDYTAETGIDEKMVLFDT